MLDITTLSSHKYIYELYMDKAENVNWRKFPIVYLNKEYCYYAVPGKSTLEYKRTSFIIETFEENSRFDNWVDRASYIHDNIRHGGRYYFWDSFVKSDEGKEFKKYVDEYHNNNYLFEERRKNKLHLDKLINNKNKLLSEIKKLDVKIKELQNKLAKM